MRDFSKSQIAVLGAGKMGSILVKALIEKHQLLSRIYRQRTGEDETKVIGELGEAIAVDLLVIRDILGHSQVSVTANIYTHVLAPELREAIRRMDVLMGAPAETEDLAHTN